MFLSFVIPLYNCQSYVAACLDEIFSCHLPKEEYEVVVVDDGSKDDGAGIVSDYCRQYSNLQFFRQENRGASSARNRGIKLAKGEYVWFVDADDKIDASVLDVVYAFYQAGNLVDLFCFNHSTLQTGGVEYVGEFHESIELDGCSYIERHPYLYLWNKIFRKSSIGEVRFPEGTRNTEDWYFDLATITDMQRVVCLPQNGYYYNTTNISSTLRLRSRESSKRNSEDSQLMHRKIRKLILQTGDERKQRVLREALDFCIAGFLYAQFVDKIPVADIRVIIRRYKDMGLYPVPNTYNKRANLFLQLANRPMLFLALSWLHIRFC